MKQAVSPLVALTYSSGRLRGLAARLQREGVRVMRRPLLTISSAAPPAPELAARALACPWVLFASPSAVAAWSAWGFPVRGRHFGATGPGTSAALRRAGASVSVMGSPADATGLARAFMQHPQARGPVLLPRGNLALPILPCLLTAAGFSSVTLPAYWCAASAWEPRQVPTVVVVASPSALPALPQRVRRSATLVTIGATTGAAARRLAGAVIEAPEPTVEGVLSALRVALGRPPGAELAPREASRPT